MVDGAQPRAALPSIALVSMPGGGKSTIGRQLAKRLGRPFWDSDAEIERQIGGTIRAYFDVHGESAFRDVESRVVDDLTRRESIVLATGGGAVLRDENRAHLKARCRVVYLHATPEELYRRLRHDTQRPLLQVADPLSRLRELYGQRDSLYRQVADFTVETGRPSMTTVVNMIMMQLEVG